MAYGVFDRQDNNEMISGAFTSEICNRHGTYGGDQPVTEKS